MDTETEYDKDYSIKDTGTRGYVEDGRFKCYLVTFANDDFTEGAAPEDIDWHKYQGATFICHNASFDQYVFEEMQVQGIIPMEIDVTFICSADMCSYLQLPRNLAGAVKTVFKHDMPKDMRNWMKGKTWQDAVDAGKKDELMKYGIDDVIWTWKLYKKLYKKWPELERRVSTINREMGWEGLPIATRDLRKDLKKMEKQIWDIHQLLPWVGEVDPDTKKPYAVTGKKGLNTYLSREGLPVVKSTAKDSPECSNWIDAYGSRCSYVADFQTLGRLNKHYASLKKIYDRLDDRGRFSYALLYAGVPKSMRFKATGGFSVHGFPKEIQYGVDMRGLVRARDGYKMIVSDLNAIEPRCTAVVTEDTEAIAAYFEGKNPYQHHAMDQMGWTGESLKKEDPGLYALAKERVLSLGYGTGWVKFLERARQFGFGYVFDREYDKFDENSFLGFLERVPSQTHYIDIYDVAETFEKRCMVNAWIQVMDFRKKNPKIKGLWDSHSEAFGKASGTGSTYKIPLLSGREIKFFKPRGELQGISCTTIEGGKQRFREYGASLYQASIQATARDVFAFHLDTLHKEGVKVIMHVHDEVVVEVKETEAEDTAKLITQVMTTTPPWAKIPLASECVISDRYFK